VGFAERVTPNASRSRCDRRRPQLRDKSQDVGEEVSRYGDLGQRERDIAPVTDDLRAELDTASFTLVSDQSLIGSALALLA
jgi:hypothetical protein